MFSLRPAGCANYLISYRGWWSRSKGASNPQPKTTKRDLNSRYLNSLLRNVCLKRFYGTEQGDHSCKQAYTEQEVPPKPALQNQGTPNNKNCFAGRVFFLLGGGASFIIRGKGLTQNCHGLFLVCVCEHRGGEEIVVCCLVSLRTNPQNCTNLQNISLFGLLLGKPAFAIVFGDFERPAAECCFASASAPSGGTLRQGFLVPMLFRGPVWGCC